MLAIRQMAAKASHPQPGQAPQTISRRRRECHFLRQSHADARRYLIGFSLVVSLFALVVAGYLVRDVWRQESSTAQIVIADAIREGARAEH